MKDLSVIIPTFNNKEKLKKVLKSLGQQKFKKIKKPNLEVIIIDDGSADEAKQEIQNLIQKNPLPIKYFNQTHRGPAAARNLGVKKAAAKVILFLDDDKIPTFDLLEEHLLSHRKYPASKVAVLGFTTWAKSLDVTPFMWWMEHGGHQFKYDEIKDRKWVDYRYFFTGNLSLKKDFLLRHGLFCEEFKVAAYEDLELGYRLQQHGLKIFYNQRAIAYHDHQTCLADTCQKMERVGRWSRLYNQKVPISKRLPRGSEPFILLLLGNLVVYPILRRLGSWCENRIALGLVFNALLLFYYTKGRRQ